MEDPVTDIVPEQVAGGDAEPAPTPAVGEIDALAKMEDVVQPGGLEKVDELVEEAKQEEISEEVREPKMEETATAETEEPEIEGSKPEEEPIIQAAAVPGVEESVVPVAEERKQERVVNPSYTLEVVGNRYNTSNFW